MEEALKPESRRKMPTVSELMRKFGASQSPVTRAIRTLEQQGIVRCRRGSGMVSCGVAETVEENLPEKWYGAEKRVLFLRTDYFAESLWNMEHTLYTYARQCKVSIITYRVDRSDDIPSIIDQVGAAYTLDGLVMNCAPEVKSDALIDHLNALPHPVVMINSSNIYENAAPHVSILSLDSAQAGRLCVEALARAGHTEIGYIRNEPECDLTRMRLAGIQEAAARLGVRVTHFPAAIKCWESSAEAAAKITVARLNDIRAAGLTGLIYFSGRGAMAGRRELERAGFRIPDDISVVSEDDGSDTEWLNPPGSIVRGDYLQACRDALDIALGQAPAAGVRLYGYRYVERESVAEPSARRTGSAT